MNHNWMQVKLNAICRPTQWPTIAQSEMTTDGYPVYGANGVIGRYTEFNHEFETLLITCRGATCGTLNVCVPNSYVTGNAMALDNLSESVSLKFLYYALRYRGLRDAITGTAQPQITRQSLESVTVPLPPLPEQHRIASILDKADAIRRKREEGIRLTEELLRSTFLEMFGDPATNPKRWPVNSMNRIAKITGGFAFKSEWFAEEGDRVIRISDIGDGKVDLASAVCVDCETYRISTAYQCVTDDILMALSGATTGKIGVVTDAESGSFVNQRVAIIRVNNRAAAPWLTQLLSNKRVLAVLLESAGGSAQANLSTKSLEALTVPVPPDDLLFQYATLAKTARCVFSRRQVATKEADLLFGSLVQRAFRGEL